MFIKLDLQSKEPLYAQLRNQIVEGIAKGDFKPGDALPSVRTMASDLGINLHTVRKAYQELQQENFLLIHRQKGVVINPDGIPIADSLYVEQLKESLRPFVTHSLCRGVNVEEFLKIAQQLFSEYTQEEGEE